jgi:hypothetical protein
MKNDPIKGVGSLAWDNLEVFYYISTSKLWPDSQTCGQVLSLSGYNDLHLTEQIYARGRLRIKKLNSTGQPTTKTPNTGKL